MKAVRSAVLGMAVVVVFFAVGVTWAADQPQGDTKSGKKDIPLYDGKPGEKIGDVCVNPKDGAEMVWVPAGEFLRGSTDKEIATLLKDFSAANDPIKKIIEAEKPQRKVYLDGYWIYRHPVTVAQYRKFCEATGRDMPEAPSWGWKDNHPMVMVNWQDATDYAKWAEVSLPTEAQWEKAARGTDGRKYPWGNEWDASKCANSGMGVYPTAVVEKKLESTQPVGSYPAGASPYGCMDMAGNVCQWCADWYDPKYYKKAPARNPTGPSKPVKFELLPGLMPGWTVDGGRVLRGDSWDIGNYGSFRCANRSRSVPSNRFDYCGFRCARTP